MTDGFDRFLSVRRRFRIVAILDGAGRAGLTPLPLLNLHAIAFFADALAPVWGIRILDAQRLRRTEGPMSPILQADVDHLVGEGVVEPFSVRHELDEDGRWALNACYRLNYDFADSILDTASSFDLQLQQLRFVREVVFAVSALGETSIEEAPVADASYGSELVDIGGMVDLATYDGRPNDTARIAARFRDLMESEVDLSAAEMIHFYVRELQKRMARVA